MWYKIFFVCFVSFIIFAVLVRNAKKIKSNNDKIYDDEINTNNSAVI